MDFGHPNDLDKLLYDYQELFTVYARPQYAETTGFAYTFDPALTLSLSVGQMRILSRISSTLTHILPSSVYETLRTRVIPPRHWMR